MADEGGNRNGGDGGIGANDGEANLSSGNVIMVVKEFKDEIVKLMEAKDANLKRRIDGLVAAMSTVTANSAGRGASSRSKSLENRKRKEPPSADKLPYFAEMVEVDPAPFYLNWCIMVTLLSVGQMFPSILDWVPPYGKDYMEEFSTEIEGVSALSVLFFSVEQDHFFSRYHGRVGKLWSIVIRASISSLILRTRSRKFSRTRPDGEPVATEPGTVQKPREPEWIRAFGGKKSTYRAVAEVVDCLETTDAMAKESGDPAYLARRKRIRMDNVPGAGPCELERDWYVRQMRSKVLRDLSYARSEARAKLIGMVMFVVEKISADFDSVEAAREAGYEVLFHSATSAEENAVPGDLSSGIWKIPCAETSGAESQIRVHNNDALQQLALAFPSLHATIKFKREILSGPGHEGLPTHYDATEQVSFHEVALTVLTAATHASSVHIALRTSPNSLRAVHFLAFGIRGLVKSCLELALSPLEKLAMGNVLHGVVDKKNGDWASTNVYDEKKNTGRERAEGTVTVQMLRDSKLTMTVNEYLLLAPVAPGPEADPTTRSERGQNEEEPEDFDLDEECFNIDVRVGSTGGSDE